MIRPGAREFLEKMARVFEVVIFTAAMQDYADWVLDALDTGSWISHRLYRQHAVREGPVYLKDLTKLGRELPHMIIVDNVAQNFARQSDNGIHIRSWFDDMEDTALFELGPILEKIRALGYQDLRVGLKEVIGGEGAVEEAERDGEAGGSGASPDRELGEEEDDFEEQIRSLRKMNKLDDSIHEEEKHQEVDINDVFAEVKDLFMNRD